MSKKIVMPALLLLIALLVALPTAAFAQNDSVNGGGNLTAQGNGRAFVEGSGGVRISGYGVLVINDKGGDAKIEVTGDGTQREVNGSVTTYYGFHGDARIVGKDFSVVLDGSNINLAAVGKGLVYLSGKGTYNSNGHHGLWTEEGVSIALDS